jgi:hypothetical protein
VQISVLLEVVDHSRCRKMFAVPTPYAPEEEEDGVRGSGKKMSSIVDVERSSRVVAPQKSNCLHTPSRVLRRTRVPEAPALPWFRARGVTGRGDSRAAEKCFSCVRQRLVKLNVEVCHAFFYCSQETKRV